MPEDSTSKVIYYALGGAVHKEHLGAKSIVADFYSIVSDTSAGDKLRMSKALAEQVAGALRESYMLGHSYGLAEGLEEN